MSKVELAVESDISELAKLLSILFVQEIEFEPNFEFQKNGLKAIIENDEIGQILVLKENNSIIGMVSLLYTISTVFGGRVAILEDMIIHPQYRNRGGGSKLLRKAIELAHESGCKRITLLTDKSNIKAINFYHSLGFEKSSMATMRLIL